jgi:3-oxoacyl-[acyl-carrier-protein] synthase III
VSGKTLPIDLASKDYQAAKRYAIQMYMEGVDIAYKVAQQSKEKYGLSEMEYMAVFEKLLDKAFSPLKYLLQEYEHLPEDIKAIFKTEEEREIDKRITELVSKRLSKIIEEAEKFGKSKEY